jgi:hypothetical protein
MSHIRITKKNLQNNFSPYKQNNFEIGCAEMKTEVQNYNPNISFIKTLKTLNLLHFVILIENITNFHIKARQIDDLWSKHVADHKTKNTTLLVVHKLFHFVYGLCIIQNKQ